MLSKEAGIDYVAKPELVATYPHALTSAIAWWQRNGMNELCDAGLDDEDGASTAVLRLVNPVDNASL